MSLQEKLKSKYKTVEEFEDEIQKESVENHEIDDAWQYFENDNEMLSLSKLNKQR